MNQLGGPARERPGRENVFINLLCNAILPGFLLQKLSRPEVLGPVWGLVVSLSLPIGYGVWDLASRRKVNLFSVLGFVSTLLTGVLGLMKTDALWIAVKEASVPLIIGIAIPFSMKSRQPLVRTLLYNDQVLDTQRIHTALEARQAVGQFDKLLAWASWVLAGSFLVSGVLNFALARWMLTAAPGTPDFNAQLGRMNWLSWPVIVLPSMAVMMFALFRLLKGAERLSGLTTDELFHPQAHQSRKS